MLTLSKNIMDNNFRAVFRAYSEIAEDKADKLDKTKLLELLAKEVTKIVHSTISTI